MQVPLTQFLKRQNRTENYKSPEAKSKKKEKYNSQGLLKNYLFLFSEYLKYSIRNLTSLWNHSINHVCLYCLVARRYSESLGKKNTQALVEAGMFSYNSTSSCISIISKRLSLSSTLLMLN